MSEQERAVLMAEETTKPKVLKIPEAAEFLRISEDTLRKEVRRGNIPAFRIGRSWRFHRDALERWAMQKSENHVARTMGSDILDS